MTPPAHIRNALYTRVVLGYCVHELALQEHEIVEWCVQHQQEVCVLRHHGDRLVVRIKRACMLLPVDVDGHPVDRNGKRIAPAVYARRVSGSVCLAHDHQHPWWQPITMIIGFLIYGVVLYPISIMRRWFLR